MLDTSFWCEPPLDESIPVFSILLMIALIISIVFVWRWIRNRNSIVVCVRCRVFLSALAVGLLYLSVIGLLLDIAYISVSLEGAGSAGSGLRMLAYSLAMQLFGFGFAGFTLTGLLALLMGLFQPRAPVPAGDPLPPT